MKISTIYLLDVLSRSYKFSECTRKSEKFTLSRPMLYERGSDILPDSVYILYNHAPDREEALRSGSLFLGTEDCPGIERMPQECTCVFNSPASPVELLNAVQMAFSTLDEWNDALQRTADSGGTIEKLLEISYPIFQNPLNLQNIDFTFVARYPKEELGDSIEESTKEKVDLVNAMKQDPVYNKNRDAEGVFYYYENTTGIGSLNANILRSGKTAFRLQVVEKDHPFRSSDASLLGHLHHFVEYALMHNPMGRLSGRKVIQNTLLHMLSDRNADYLEISHELTGQGWQREHRYICLLFETSFMDRENLTELTQCNYIESVLPGCCALPWRGNIVAYVDLDLCGMSVDQIVEKLIYFVRDSYLKLSVSSEVAGHMYLHRQYLQARAAARIGKQVHPYLWIHRFDDYSLQYILSQATLQLPGSMLCHRGLIRLHEYDQAQGTDLCHTLRIYFNNHKNAVKTARDLYIHRSTLLYRIDRIMEITGSNLEDPDEALHILLSFKLLDLENPKASLEQPDAEADGSAAQSKKK